MSYLNFSPNTRYTSEVALSTAQTYLKALTLGNCLKIKTHEDRLSFLDLCTKKTKLQKLYNPETKTYDFTDSTESYIFANSFYFFTEYLNDQRINKTLAKTLSEQLELNTLETTELSEEKVFPVILSASLAFALHQTKYGSYVTNLKRDVGYCNSVSSWFSLSETDEALLRIVLTLTCVLLEDGYLSCGALHKAISSCNHLKDEPLMVALETLGLLLELNPEVFVDFRFSELDVSELTYNEYTFLVALVYLLKSNVYSENSQRPKNYLTALVEEPNVSLPSLLGVFGYLTLLSEHNYSLFFKSLGKNLKSTEVVTQVIHKYYE